MYIITLTMFIVIRSNRRYSYDTCKIRNEKFFFLTIILTRAWCRRASSYNPNPSNIYIILHAYQI